MPKTPERECPYKCGRLIPEGAGRMTCGKQPCLGMARSNGLREHHRLKKMMGGNLTLADKLDLGSEHGMQPTGQCVIWYGSTRSPSGFGQIHHEGKTLSVHRVAYELANGPIREGMYILHKEDCNEPRCINGECLYEGTPSDTIYAQVKRGTHGRKSYHITPEVAEKIRQLVYVDQLDNDAIGEMYGIDDSHVSRIAWRMIYSDRPLNDWERERLEARIAKKRRDNQRRRHALTPEQIEEIEASSETGRVLAKRYGVAESTISKAKRGLYDSDGNET